MRCGRTAGVPPIWAVAPSTVSARRTRLSNRLVSCWRSTRACSGHDEHSIRLCELVLEVSHLTKEYPTPRGPLVVLSDVSFTLASGEAAAMMGPSGSGKSSLLYALGALEPPSDGTITLDGRNPFVLAQ